MCCVLAAGVRRGKVAGYRAAFLHETGPGFARCDTVHLFFDVNGPYFFFFFFFCTGGTQITFTTLAKTEVIDGAFENVL